MLGVEDPEGNVAYLKLFNYAMLIDVTREERDSVIPVGSILIIREPSYVTNSMVPSLPYIKVDTPSDVVHVDPHPILHDVSWKSHLTMSGRPSSGEAWRAMGLKSFKEKRWFSCAIAFSNCIKLEYDIQLSRLNRSEAYLRLGWNNSAFHDSKDALDSGTLSEDKKKKAVVRIIKAQYAMHQYSAVFETAKALPNDKSVDEWTTKASRRIQEQATGDYDWVKLRRRLARRKIFILPTSPISLVLLK